MTARNEEIQNEKELILRQPDAVMEPAVLQVVAEYVKAKGKPAAAIDMLADGYTGYAQMASLMCSWIEGADTASEEPLPPEKKAEADEFTYLAVCEALAQERFVPEEFDEIFKNPQGGPPPWIAQLAADPAGRQLYYSLTSSHRNCLLLNYAVQRIINAGHEREVATMGSSLASNFGVFHRLLSTRLRDALQADEARLQQLSKELQESCCTSQHAYLYVQMLLTELAQQPGGGRFELLSQELEAAAAQQHRVALRMRQFLLPADATAADCEAAALVSDLLAAGTPAAARAALPKLNSLYCRPGDGSTPALRVLQHPQVFSILVEQLFTPGAKQAGKAAPELQGQCVQLLAVAAAAEAEQRVQRAVELAQLAASGAAIRDPMADRDARAALSLPCCGQGVLHCVRASLAGDGSARGSAWASAQLNAAPSLLGLLAALVSLQPALHEQIIALVVLVLHSVPGAAVDVARAFLDLLVLCLRGGCVEPTLERLLQYVARPSTDLSLVRHFLFKALGACAPPYSARFAALVTRLMQRSGVKVLRSLSTLDMRLMQEFMRASRDLPLQRLLQKQELEYLRTLQISLKGV